MITYHVILDRIRKRLAAGKVGENIQVLPFQMTTDDAEAIHMDKTSKIEKINRSAIAVFPILNTIFYGIYVYYTLN